MTQPSPVQATTTRPLGAVPFADHAGVETLAAGPEGGLARIPEAVELTNHIASVHAGALFTVGETASGAAMLGAFAGLIGQVRPVTRKSEIRYLRIARGEITAWGELSEAADAIRARLEANGKVDFDVEVTLTDPTGETVAQMTVTWNLSRRS